MKKNTFIKVLIGVAATSFILVMAFLVAGITHAEETTQEATQEASNVVDWLKTWSIDDIKAWIVVLASKLGIDVTLLFTLAIALIRTKVREARTTEFYKELIAKLDAEHQKKVEDMILEFDEKLAKVEATVTDSIKMLDEKKRKEADDEIAVLKNKLEEIKIETEKQ